MNGSPVSAISKLDTIGLTALDHAAALQTRKDRKYLVPVPQLADIIERVDVQVLEIGGLRTFGYESVYFDTPDRVSYLAAARRRRRRFKVRTRSYLDTDTCVLEVKTRERRGLTTKQRIPYDINERERLNREALTFIDRFDTIAPISHDLRPALTTRYDRTTLFEPSSRSRITVDTDLVCVADDGASVSLPGMAVVETKTDGRPCSVDHSLWEAHRRPVKMSKYGTGLAALDPTLPANKWNRVLRDYFGWSPGNADARHLPSDQRCTRTVASAVPSPVAQLSYSHRPVDREVMLEGARS